MTLSITVLYHYAECQYAECHVGSFLNGVSVVKWKVSKRALKFFAHSYMDGRVCICLCVCLSRYKIWITFDGINGYWCKFQDQSNSVQVFLCWGRRSACLKNMALVYCNAGCRYAECCYTECRGAFIPSPCGPML
jgi:hypothetical protein